MKRHGQMKDYRNYCHDGIAIRVTEYISIGNDTKFVSEKATYSRAG